MTTKEAMSELGRIGGSVKSARKTKAARQNLAVARSKKIPVERAPIAALSTKQIGQLAAKFVAEYRAAQG